MDRLVSYSPITLEEVGSVEITTADMIPGIVERSKNAQKKWMSLPKKERVRLLRVLSRMTADRCEEIGEIVHKDTGKPKAECINTEMFVSSSYASYCADWLESFRFTRSIRMDPIHGMLKLMGRQSVINYKPAGTVLCISPYNFPVSISFTEIAAAVAAGNSVILKPSSNTPLCGEAIAGLFEDSGFPRDLVMCVHGPGIGDALTRADGINRIVFTGSTETGKAIMRAASERLVPVTMELGGCDSMIVLRDADVDRAVKAAVWGSFTNAGQVCVGVQRIMVQKDVYEEFRDKYVRCVKSLRIGDGWNDPEVSVGPVISERAMKDVLEAIEKAKQAGGTVLCGGRRADMEGYFIEPTVIADLPTDSDIYNTEVFGPFTTIISFDTEDEAIEINNKCPYALGGSVWTKDVKHGKELISRMDSGNLDVNNLIYGFGIASTPWGGSKESGFGRSHGDSGFLELMEIQHIHSDKGRYPNDPWWMPYSKESTELQTEMTQSLFGSRKGRLKFLLHALPLMRRKD